MGMGRSGGRSAKNRTGEGAVRRATPRERDLVDPPGQAPVPGRDYRPGSETWIWTPRGERFLSVVAFISLVAFSSLCAIIVASWWGLI